MATIGSDSVRIVKLAGKEYIIHTIPMAKAMNLLPAILEAFKNIDTQGMMQDEEKAQSALGQIGTVILSMPHAILSIFIRDLPREIFLDEENGVSWPEFLDALDKAIELNRLVGLKNFFMGLRPATLVALLDQVQKIPTSLNGTSLSSSSKFTA